TIGRGQTDPTATFGDSETAGNEQTTGSTNPANSANSSNKSGNHNIASNFSAHNDTAPDSETNDDELIDDSGEAAVNDQTNSINDESTESGETATGNVSATNSETTDGSEAGNDDDISSEINENGLHNSATQLAPDNSNSGNHSTDALLNESEQLNQYASAQDSSSQTGETGSSAAQNTSTNGQSTNNSEESSTDENKNEDSFLIGLSLKAEAHKIYQSFDFADGSTQQSAPMPAGSEIIFSLSMGKNVDPESINIKISDGSQEISGNLKRMSESFAYIFDKATSEAFIQLSGKAGKSSFNYRVEIPVNP
ncbi:MAG: hypothetical protein PHV05_03205, partial [Candidatus Riflebacteria bacterium]|nr:hypothetical protein [Candidatus Riflebacteria bacterium]